MGMYTALVLDARLKANVPDQVIETLKFMMGPGTGVVDPPEHPLFGDTRWAWMLKGSSAYFPIEREPLLYRPFYGADETSKPVLLSVGCSLKNYDNEIALFLDWLTPYIEEAVGYSMYEGDEQITPILISHA